MSAPEQQTLPSPRGGSAGGALPGAAAPGSLPGKAGKKPVNWVTAWAETRTLIYEHRRRLMGGFALLMLNRAAGFVLPGSSKILFDEVVAKHHAEWLLPLAAIVAVAVLIEAASSFALSQLLGVAAQKAINDMRQAVHAHVLRLPVRWFDTTPSGQAVTRIMNDAEGVRNLVGTGLVQLVGGTLTALVALSVLCWLNWRLTLGLVVALAGFGTVMSVAFSRLRPLFRDRNRLQSELTGRLTESLGGIRVIKAYAVEAREGAAFAAGTARLFDNIRTSMRGVSATTAAGSVTIGVVGVILLIVGGHDLLANHMTTGDFILYLLLAGMVTVPVVQIASIGTQLTEAFAGLDRIRDVRRLATEDDGDAERAACPTVHGEVVFDAVQFSYQAGAPVLRDISFTAAPGTTVALVGASGSGKSTLISLILAFNRPDHGRILIDGRDLAGLKLRDYRRQLGVVLQDNVLFDGTVADNIAFARPDASRAEIERMATLANAHEFVSGFEKGYDTIVGERGVRLSGGQRQRLAIARALLADPRILILDEATSALDSDSEAAIQEALGRLRTGRTTFVIAHRLSTIRDAEQILVLEGGAIIERGTHAELLAADGRYRALHDRQFRIERERYVNPGEELRHPAKA